MIVKETKQKKMSTRTRIVIWVALILLFFYLIWDVQIGTVGESWTWNTLWESNLFRIICVCFVVYGIYYFFFKKKKAKDQTAKKTDPDHHTDPEVEKHTNDDHAHHGDTWSSKIAVRLIGLGWIIGGIIAFCIVIHLFIPERYTVRANQLVSFEKKKSGLLYVTSSEKIRLYIPDGRTFIVYPNGGGSALERSSGLTGDGDQRDVSALPKGIYKIEGLEGTATVYRAEDWYHKSMAQLLTLWW